MTSFLDAGRDYDTELNDIFVYINEQHLDRPYNKYSIANLNVDAYIVDKADSVSTDADYSPEDKPAISSSSQFSEDSDNQSVTDVLDLPSKHVDVPKHCVVCFEPTKCYHYDVPSCTGCKTFFRRCLITGKRYKCPYGGQCDIQKGEDCRGCRFERCLISGMNPSAIQYPSGVDVNTVIDNVKQLKRKLIEDNRPIISKMLPAFSQTEERRQIDFLLYLEAKQRKLRESHYNPRYLYGLSVRDLLERTTELSLADKFEKPAEWPIDTNLFIQEMINRKIKREKSDDNVFKTREEKEKRKWFVPVDIILQIEMAKVMEVFNVLSLDDREKLMKHVTVSNVMLTQSFYSYLNHLNVIAFPNGFIPVKLDQAFGRTDPLKYDTHTRAVECVARAALRPEQFVLLKALIYCQPGVDGLSAEGKEVVTKHHEKYSRILLHHLQNEMGTVSGASKYAEIISLISTYFHFAEKAKQINIVHELRCHRHCKQMILSRDECMK